MYNKTYYSREDLLADLIGKIDALDLNKIESAYEMADNALFDKLLNDGTSLFFHSTRVCKILIRELNQIEPELLISSLLHEVILHCEEINSEILTFNFGSYISFMSEILNDDIEIFAIKNNEIENIQKISNRVPLEDYLIMKLAEILDKTRSIDPTINFNPMSEFISLTQNILPFAENNQNQKIQYLVNNIKSEKNRFFN